MHNTENIDIKLINTFNRIVECTLLTSSNCAPGARVERGKAWAWGDEDSYNGKPGYGTITHCNSGGHIAAAADMFHHIAGGMMRDNGKHIGAAVKWDNGKSKMYSVDEMDNLCKLIFI